jgi:hypothetical protein
MVNLQRLTLQSVSSDGARTRAAVLVLIFVWAALAAAGMFVFNRYQHTAGVATQMGDWPAGSNLQRRAGKLILVVIAHPQCVCTEATLAELTRLLATSSDAVETYVIFATLANGKDTAATSHLIRRAKAIPGVRVIIDRDARLAHQFPAQTSGQTFLYDAGGRLVFSGGITAARGHEGPNQGIERIRQALGRRAAPGQGTPVFGCVLPTVVMDGASR